VNALIPIRTHDAGPVAGSILAATAATAAILSVAGCSGEQASSGGRSMPPLPVETATVTVGEIVDRFTAVGSLEASKSITVVAEIDAIVEGLPFAEGQPLATGDVIAQLDDEELSAQVARAAAVRDQQAATYERVRSVVEQGAGAPQDLDDAAAALKVAEADLALAKARLAKARITAPFPGIAGRRLVSPGAFLRAGAPITDLVRIDELRVNFTVPERLLGRLQRGAHVSVSTTAFPGKVLDGTVDVIDPMLDAGTRSARIVARVANRERLLRPGMSADVAVVLNRSTDALTIPSEAVFVQSGQTMVYVVQTDSTVAPRPVTLGLRQAETVEIASGLEPGNLVVRAGHKKIFPGARVMPIQSGTAGGSPGDATSGPPGDATSAPPGAAHNGPTGDATSGNPSDESGTDREGET
jgi:membrane fusion protein (multidrug efflux system)